MNETDIRLLYVAWDFFKIISPYLTVILFGLLVFIGYRKSR